MKENEIELIKDVEKAKIDLENASKNFEIAEEEMIDYYTYQIKANKSKIDYLIKKIKQKGIILEVVNAINIKEVI